MDREKGPVEILCREIGYHFDRRMETVPIFVSFVAVLVTQVADIRGMNVQISDLCKDDAGRPSDNSGEILRRVREMLADGDRDGMIQDAAKVRGFIREALSEGTYPTDHLIDMLSSCVSAIRFGLEKPCRSRHAAEAANHIWKHRYGVRLFDSFTPAWQKDWTRAQLREAIFRLSHPANNVSYEP